MTSALKPWPAPARGQVWRIGEDAWYLRRRTENERGQVNFEAREVNGPRFADVTLEFLEDADERFVAYLGTVSYDA